VALNAQLRRAGRLDLRVGGALYAGAVCALAMCVAE